MTAPARITVTLINGKSSFVANGDWTPAPFQADYELIDPARKRTIPQNSTIHKWYADIASQTDGSFIGVRAECKLVFGVPILRRDSEAFREQYDKDFRPLPHETKLRLFRTLDPAITSKMNVKQLTEYMKEMQKHFAEVGVMLTDLEAGK